MTSNRSLLITVIACASCAPNVPQNPPATVVVAQYDPLASPPLIPLPNDLALQNGHLAIPDYPTDSKAQLAFNQYLRTLDGFPPSASVTASFSEAIDSASATVSNIASEGAISVIDLSVLQPFGPKDFQPQVSTDGKTLTIAPTKAWQLGHRYAVMVFGGDDPKGLRAKDPANKIVAAPFTFFLRSPRPLLSQCPDLARSECLCPLDTGTHSYPKSCMPALGLTFDQASLLEGPRKMADSAFTLLFNVVGGMKERKNLVLFWTFTIAKGPFAVFDPLAGRVPFPNDALVDQTTGKVNLPVDPNASAAQKAILAGLNTLDGFSTTADVTVPLDTVDRMAPLGATPGETVLLLDATKLDKPPTFTVAPQVDGSKNYTGLLALSPTRPLLPDGDQYVGVLTTGITDSAGRPIHPSPVMQFVLSPDPLFDAAKQKSTVSLLDDVSAGKLEVLRSAYLPLWQLFELLGIARNQVAMVWTFKTQSTTQALRALFDYPATKSLPTDVTLLDSPTVGDLGADVGRLVFGKLHTHVALGATGTLDLAGGKDVDIPFLMSVPTVVPPGGAPVAIFQHGLGGWRGDLRRMAQSFAQKGWATVGIDINYNGSRSLCTKNAECANGMCKADGTCTTSLAVACHVDGDCTSNGTCDKKTGVCSTALATSSVTCMTHVESQTPVTECNPVASGSAFLNFANPFATRDNFRQHVLDLAQLVRVVKGSGNTGLKAKLAALSSPITIDNTRLGFVGLSLGGIEGTLFLSVASEPLVGALSAPGGRIVDVLMSSPAFQSSVTAVLQANGVTAGSKDYFQLVNTFRWIFDPADPINFARYVVGQPFGANLAKKVIVQEAGDDQVVPNKFTEALAVELGLPLVDGHAGVSAVPASMPQSAPKLTSTYFAGAPHGFLIDGAAATAAAQKQAVTWIDSDGKLIF